MNNSTAFAVCILDRTLAWLLFLITTLISDSSNLSFKVTARISSPENIFINTYIYQVDKTERKYKIYNGLYEKFDFINFSEETYKTVFFS